MIIERLTTPGLAIHSYLVGCPAAGEAVVIDPTRHVGGLLALAERGHFDRNRLPEVIEELGLQPGQPDAILA